MHRKIERFKGIQAGLGVVVALVAGCYGAPEPTADERPGQAQSALEPTPVLVRSIDDFTTGKYAPPPLHGTGQLQESQSGNGIIGGSRCTFLGVTANPLDRPATVEIRDGLDGYLAVDTGVGVHQALMLLYGYDAQCNAVGLDVDLTGMSHIQVDLATIEYAQGTGTYGALDLGTAGGIVVWSENGSASVPFGIPAEATVARAAKDDFVGDVDWEHVQQIAVEIQTGGSVPGHDYALRAISAVYLQPDGE